VPDTVASSTRSRIPTTCGPLAPSTRRTAMDVLHAHCCGIDVHAKFVVACCRHIGSTGSVTKTSRTFGTMTADLQALAAWLTSEAVTHVAIESTGVLWQPVWNILEPHVTIVLRLGREAYARDLRRRAIPSPRGAAGSQTRHRCGRPQFARGRVLHHSRRGRVYRLGRRPFRPIGPDATHTLFRQAPRRPGTQSHLGDCGVVVGSS
jgi:hypothetical protein